MAVNLHVVIKSAPSWTRCFKDVFYQFGTNQFSPLTVPVADQGRIQGAVFSIPPPYIRAKNEGLEIFLDPHLSKSGISGGILAVNMTGDLTYYPGCQSELSSDRGLAETSKKTFFFLARHATIAAKPLNFTANNRKNPLAPRVPTYIFGLKIYTLTIFLGQEICHIFF